MKDRRHVLRGKFRECDKCDEHEFADGNHPCVCCGHKPVDHEHVGQIYTNDSIIESHHAMSFAPTSDHYSPRAQS